MVHVRRLVSVLLTISLLLYSAGAALASDGVVTVTILESSDLHGSIMSYDYANDAPTAGTGLSRVASVVKAEREKDKDLLLFDCGDSIQGNMISFMMGDVVHPMVNAMNFVGYDAWQLGNHEFNYDFDMLERAISFFGGDVLCANAYNADGSRWLKPWSIYEVKGVKIGVFGIISPHIPLWEAADPSLYNDMSFASAMDETGRMVEELRDKVDVLIGLVHYGKPGEYGERGMSEVSDMYPEVDAFLVGHAHEAFAEIRENGVAMVEPGGNGSYVGKLTVVLEKEGGKFKVVDKIPELIKTADYDEDAEFLKAMRYVHDGLVEVANTVVSQVEGDFLSSLEWKDIPGIPTAQIQDSALMDLINGVQMYYTGADASLAALYSTQSNLTTGEFRIKDAVNVFKYEFTLVAVEVTGSRLREIMERRAGAYFNPFTPGDVTISFNPAFRGYNYDMFAGVGYEIDISKSVGERIVNLTFEGEPVEDDEVFVLALNNYRYGELVDAGLLDPDNVVFNSVVDMPLTPTVRDMICLYAREKGGLVPYCDDNWRIVGADIDGPDAERIYQMVRDGIITIPVSEDGWTPNVKSLNAIDLRAQGLLDKAAPAK